MKQTKQREVILQVMKAAARPLTREEVLQAGRIHLPRLGSATVDRALRNLTESYQLIGVQFPGQPRRYELPAPSEHPHFICRRCERVFDLPVTMRLPKINAPEGFDIQGGEVIYSGSCPECR